MADLLLDTHVMLGMIDPEHYPLPEGMLPTLGDAAHSLSVSSISLWEIAIKHRMGKLPLLIPLDEWPLALSDAKVRLVDISVAHILAELEPLPSTKDPFDRLLLATAEIENLQFVTVDRALLSHPLAWRP